jgi:RimJ/RimL family protein N-acetyltransferase
MYSIVADYVIELPSTPHPIRRLVFRRWCGFEVRALRLISYHAAREMNWAGGIRLPAYGYLFVERRPGNTPAEVANTVVGAAFFSQHVHADVNADWFMTGVWLHPSARGRGHFTRALAEMEAAFGHFAVCEPYSEGFKALMRRRPAVEAHAVEKLRAAG